LIVRLRGSQAAVDEARTRLGGEAIGAGAAEPFWRGLRDHTDPFFEAAQDAALHLDATLWRLSLPKTAPLLGLAGDELIEWHGAQRWLATSVTPAGIREAAVAAGGHATIFRSRDKAAGVFAPLSPPLRAIHSRLKQSFDPKGVFNPGRLYPGL
ncbi:MAG: glycolate oxidase subunit GlcE, partial [Caldimonas sp.]